MCGTLLYGVNGTPPGVNGTPPGVNGTPPKSPARGYVPARIIPAPLECGCSEKPKS